MKLRPKIDSHDYETKKGHVVRFLKAGDKVKITIMFRGREQSRPELGYNLLKKLSADVDEFGFVESSPKQDGRNMFMVLGPHKKKTEAKVDAAAERDRRAAAARPTPTPSSAAAEQRREPPRRPPAPQKRRRGPADNMDPDIDLAEARAPDRADRRTSRTRRGSPRRTQPAPGGEGRWSGRCRR